MMTGVLALIGCSEGRDEHAAQRVRNTPPTPPNCPELPELGNITLKDGSLAHVRIIRDGDATFYVPLEWFEWEARVSGKPDEYWRTLQSGVVGKYDIEANECPGVVHEREFGYATPLISIHGAETGRGIPPGFSDNSEINRIQFYKIHIDRPGFKNKIERGRIDEDIEPLGVGYEAFVKVGPEHLASYALYDVGVAPRGAGPEWEAFRNKVMSTESWKNKRESARDLFEWLQTPPKDRDNGRIFQLGVKSK